VFDADRAVELARNGQQVILVRPETSPEDVAGMYASEGIVTARGGRTSHAAVVAVGMGKPCIVGANDIVVDEERRVFEAGGRVVREGDIIAIDGETGEVILDAVERTSPEVGGAAQEFLAWADRYRTLGVRANADTPDDAARAREFGAEGIGLVRTEHMFFAADRIPIVRDMIMASDPLSQQGALDKLLPFQREDFVGIFRAMDGLPVTIRLLDPPLHEFLAHGSTRSGSIPRARPPWTRSWRRSTRCARPIRCSAIVAAGSASPRRRSTACRCAPSWRPPARSRSRACAWSRRS
jgi:pyruvate,orthophosphate dikinase